MGLAGRERSAFTTQQRNAVGRANNINKLWLRQSSGGEELRASRVEWIGSESSLVELSWGDAPARRAAARTGTSSQLRRRQRWQRLKRHRNRQATERWTRKVVLIRLAAGAFRVRVCECVCVCVFARVQVQFWRLMCARDKFELCRAADGRRDVIGGGAYLWLA